MTTVPAPFGFQSTASEVIAGVDLSGKRAIVTGGASGIGIETTRALAAAGAAVVVAVRRPEAAREVAEAVSRTVRNPVEVRTLDLADPSLIEAFAGAWDGPLDILVNNAGVMAIPELERTAHGWEMQFATNFLGHFALTNRLQPALAAARGARVVLVSSSANLMGPVLFDDPHFRFIPYTPFLAYAQSKTALILMAVAAARRWREDGVSVNALNPGAIPTNLQRYTGGLRTPEPLRKTPAQGAATSVLLAASPTVDGVSGAYFEDCAPAPVVNARPTDFTGGVAPFAVDPQNAERLWALGEDLTGVGAARP